MKIASYSICSPIKGVCKSWGIWANGAERNGTYPLVYFIRPRWIDESQWEEIVQSITLNLPQGYEVKRNTPER